MIKILGEVKNKNTGVVLSYVDKDVNGFEIVQWFGKDSKVIQWVPKSNWEELGNREVQPSQDSPVKLQNDIEKVISDLCDDLKITLISKNRDYGNSVEKTYEEFGDIAFIVRSSDKLERIKRLDKATKEVDESKEDTWKDLAGYSILRNAVVQLRGANNE